MFNMTHGFYDQNHGWVKAVHFLPQIDTDCDMKSMLSVKSQVNWNCFLFKGKSAIFEEILLNNWAVFRSSWPRILKLTCTIPWFPLPQILCSSQGTPSLLLQSFKCMLISIYINIYEDTSLHWTKQNFRIT